MDVSNTTNHLTFIVSTIIGLITIVSASVIATDHFATKEELNKTKKWHDLSQTEHQIQRYEDLIDSQKFLKERVKDYDPYLSDYYKKRKSQLQRELNAAN